MMQIMLKLASELLLKIIVFVLLVPCDMAKAKLMSVS